MIKTRATSKVEIGRHWLSCFSTVSSTQPILINIYLLIYRYFPTNESVLASACFMYILLPTRYYFSCTYLDGIYDVMSYLFFLACSRTCYGLRMAYVHLKNHGCAGPILYCDSLPGSKIIWFLQSCEKSWLKTKSIELSIFSMRSSPSCFNSCFLFVFR